MRNVCTKVQSGGIRTPLRVALWFKARHKVHCMLFAAPEVALYGTTDPFSVMTVQKLVD